MNTKRFRPLFVLLALAGFGCASDSVTVCEVLSECTTLVRSSDVEACAESIEDDVSDGSRSEDDVADCADCLGQNTCVEISEGDCTSACSELFSRM